MDSQSGNMKNILVELESLKSKEAIFKMKENNLMRDKEILEDSINKFQTELGEKSELIRLLRRDLNTQSSNLYKDLEIKNNELDKVILENQDIKKQNVIFQETIEHHVQKLETMKLEMDKQLKFYEREIDCKSRLAGFYESSNQQKENKLSLISDENEHYKEEINELKLQLNNLKAVNDELSINYEESSREYQNDLMERDQEIQRMKTEIIQLQQNGISEFHLEKMNPIAAATLKVLKSSKGLMEIYSELHLKISEVDQLQMEKDRLIRNKDSLESELHNIKIYSERINHESDELRKTNESLKSRLFSRVTDLEKSKSKVGDLERQLLVCRKNLQTSHSEIERLNEQVRLLIVVAENGSQIKQEAVDADSGLYASVAELQEVNRSLRISNENLISQLESSDSQQYKQRYEELKKYSDKLSDEAKQLQQENSANRSQLILHEKQIKLLRYLIELKNPGTSAAIESGLNRLEFGNIVTLDCEDESEIPTLHLSMEKLSNDESGDQFQQQESMINELLDNKRASDEVYVFSIEQMRNQLMELSKKCNHLQDKLEMCTEQLKDEKDINEKYYQECALLRSLNKNLSTNTANLESHIEDLKIKLQSKISLLAERKADIDSCKNTLDITKSENLRLKIERDEYSKTIDVQEKILANISSLKSGADLADHFSRIQAQNRIDTLEKASAKLLEDIKEKAENIDLLNKQLEESRALEAVPRDVNLCDGECQVNIQIFEEAKINGEISSSVIIDDSELIASRNEIVELQNQLASHKSVSDQSISKLQVVIEKYEIDMKDLTEKCAFFETQIGLQEKARQEILNENIKLSEEAHKMNSSLKQELHNCQEELAAMKIRLDEAETVERTVQEVIDKFVKEANEAKAKYKRELTLHAADSKLLESTRKEIEDLQSKDRLIDDEYDKLKSELKSSEESRKQQIEEMRSQYKELEMKLQECENRNENLFEQLKEINNHGSNSSYLEIIDDLKNQINIGKMSSNLSNIQKERYENEISRLHEELNDMKEQSSLAINRLNKSQCEDSASSLSIETEVIRESNYVLRQQKEQLEQTLIVVRCDNEELSEKICNLEGRVAELFEQKNVLIENKTELEEEKNRWKDRCTKLVERAEQMDPEQYKQACNDRDKLRKQVQELEINVKELKELLKSKENETKVILEENNDKLKKLEMDLCVVRQEVELEKRKLEELGAKLKREESIVAQLKDIGRKHKGESEKRRQSIIELEKEISRLQDQLSVIRKEKEEVVKEMNATALELESKSEQLGELQTRCDMLEKMNTDNSFKIQLKDNMIGELHVNINELRSNLKRRNSGGANEENELGECKKMRFCNDYGEITYEEFENEENQEDEEKFEEGELNDEEEFTSADESSNQIVDNVEPGQCEEEDEMEDEEDVYQDNNSLSSTEDRKEIDEVEEENVNQDQEPGNFALSEDRKEVGEIEEENVNEDQEPGNLAFSEDKKEINEIEDENVNENSGNLALSKERKEIDEIEEKNVNEDQEPGNLALSEERKEIDENVNEQCDLMETHNHDEFVVESNEEPEDGEESEEVEDYETNPVEKSEDDVESIVLIDSDTEEKDSVDGNEEDFEAIVLEVESSLENLEKSIQMEDELETTKENPEKPQSEILSKDTIKSCWDEKLIEMIAANSASPIETSNNEIVSRPNMRARLRRPLRRPTD